MINKFKRGDHYAPLQFITSYTPEQCARRLKTAYPTVKLQRIREDRIKFKLTRIAHGYQIHVEGMLQAWAAGAQTRVTCKIRGTMPELDTSRSRSLDLSWLFGEEPYEQRYEKQYNRYRKKISLTYDAIVALLATPPDE